jgi:hypothetical protein
LQAGGRKEILSRHASDVADDRIQACVQAVRLGGVRIKLHGCGHAKAATHESHRAASAASEKVDERRLVQRASRHLAKLLGAWRWLGMINCGDTSTAVAVYRHIGIRGGLLPQAADTRTFSC